ncbi:hypothetical protein [Compostimonas suwonensis]|uniref:Uncharacterized protein n=1 Tax=Compostimonas suwonensis TaxID=1048394 RepID=A0A2M9BVH1_9MICO|nr:hypothetical protein [Compostimonas suwonensis]PJJ61957.1 hypothetical protein CLV54_1748 [Compostimonas suwonensis]
MNAGPLWIQAQRLPVASVDGIAAEAGLTPDEGDTLSGIYSESQVSSLRTAFFALIVIVLLSLLFSRGIPSEVPGRRDRTTVS